MGYRDKNGDFVFQPGFGRGRLGMPYDASVPQGRYWRGDIELVPFWARDPAARRETLLVYMERRAFLSRRRQLGSYLQRLVACTDRLQAQHAKKWETNEANKTERDYQKRKTRLEATRDFETFLEKVIEDFYPSGEHPNSWDCGQTAWRSGIGMDNKILVKQLLQDVNEIGCELFPEPRTEPVDSEIF